MTGEQPKCPYCNLPLENCECEERIRKFKEERYKGLEAKEKQEIEIAGHKIEIVNYNLEVKITENHLERLRTMYEKVWQIAPELIRSCNSLIITADQPPQRPYSRYESFGLSENLPNDQSLIEIFPLATRLDTNYRSSDRVIKNRRDKGFSDVTNWEGTILHELAHNIRDPSLLKEWEKRFGWQNDSLLIFYAQRDEKGVPVYEKVDEKSNALVINESKLSSEGWKRTKNEFGIFLLNEKTDYRVGIDTRNHMPNFANGVKISDFTTQPERCVTDYARTNSAEDLCESFVAYLTNPGILDPEKRKMIDEWVKKKKAERKHSSPEVPIN